MPVYQTEVGVNCILIKNTRPIVEIFNTSPIGDSVPAKRIINADIKMERNDGLLYEFELSVDSTHYSSNTYVAQGHSYILEASYDGKTYTASTSIPKPVNNLLAEYDYGNYIDEYGEYLTHMEIRFEDAPEEDNFFQMLLYRGSSLDGDGIYNFWAFHNISDPILVAESLLEYEPLGFIFTDTHPQNNRIQIDLLGSLALHNSRPAETGIVIRSISEEYFNFLRSWIIHYYNQNNPEHVNVIDDLDPYRIFFQEQPVPLYSNIEGGTGIFAGYSETRKSFVYVD